MCAQTTRKRIRTPKTSCFRSSKRRAAQRVCRVPPVGGQLTSGARAQVTHAKNKWKCVLRSGQMTLNGKDYVFNTAAGDFQW